MGVFVQSNTQRGRDNSTNAETRAGVGGKDGKDGVVGMVYARNAVVGGMKVRKEEWPSLSRCCESAH